MLLTPARQIDRDSLCLLMEKCTDASPFKIKRQIDRLKTAFSLGQLFIPPDETEQQKWWRCEARMMLGDYSDWSGWEYRDNWAATLWHTKPYPVPAWNGLPTDCLYVIGEQGIGDEVFFASCLHEAQARCKRIIFETMPRLQSVFGRLLNVETVPSKIIDGIRHKQDFPEGVTAWMGLGDLPRMWRRGINQFPIMPRNYIGAQIEQIRRFDDYRGMTGISWRGAQGEIPELMAMYPDAVSLQYDQAWDEDMPRVPGLDLHNDIEGVMGLLANLDRVITVSTSVAHFAAAMGKETHVIIADPKTARRGNIFPWKWICRKTPGRTPWYPSARVYDSLRDYRARNVT